MDQEKARAKLAEQNKLMPRERMALLFDTGTALVEDGVLANNLAADLPADGVITGVGIPPRSRLRRGDGQRLVG